MDSLTNNKSNPVLITFLVPLALNVYDNLEKESVVIPDECGDTLWDEVLSKGIND